MKKETVEISDVRYEPDSIEIGTPSKGGVIKVYGDAANLDAWKAKITSAIEALEFAVASKDHTLPKKEETSTTDAPTV